MALLPLSTRGDEILDRRDKVGFATPWAEWTRGRSGVALTDRLREAERELAAIVEPNILTVAEPAALGVMAIASIRSQLAQLQRPAATIA